MLVDKKQVALRQLDTAIRLLFDNGDIISIHTLSCAAAQIFQDLLKAKGGETWRDAIIESHPGMEREIRETLVRARNFFKHADRDPYEALEFDETVNDETIIVATLEYGEILRLGAPPGRSKTTEPMSVFQLWYFAKNPAVLLAAPDDTVDEVLRVSTCLFPDLHNLPRADQLAWGAELLQRREAATR